MNRPISKTGANGAVLLVDDDAPLLEAYVSTLRETGYRVEGAGDGTGALAQLAETCFDVVVSDIVMPGMDGLRLLRAVRKLDLDVPVLLITGNANLESATQALNEGATRYLTKPVSASQLVEAVAAGVRLHRIARLKREALVHLGMEDRLVGDRAGLDATFERAVDSFWMEYQPIRLAAGGDYGHEALLRSREATFPRPQALLLAAERLGRVHDLGRRGRDIVADDRLRGVFVNIHPLDLSDELLFSPDAPLSKCASDVVLEITERASLDEVPEIRSRVARLKDLGYRIAIDDLGAGYAGLTSFAALEPDLVKLDMALIRGVDTKPLQQRLIRSLVEACHDFGILVLAEGIETAAGRDSLLDLDCDLLQGFLFGYPARLEGLLRRTPPVSGAS